MKFSSASAAYPLPFSDFLPVAFCPRLNYRKACFDCRGRIPISRWTARVALASRMGFLGFCTSSFHGPTRSFAFPPSLPSLSLSRPRAPSPELPSLLALLAPTPTSQPPPPPRTHRLSHCRRFQVTSSSAPVLGSGPRLRSSAPVLGFADRIALPPPIFLFI
jgi:hypothetical protein